VRVCVCVRVRVQCMRIRLCKWCKMLAIHYS